ncbi:MAG: hypothetical protein L0Z53_24395, partial [Acidobacteriales bacterium]|nr:hypothetical protein [Terriglobales bacterium]
RTGLNHVRVVATGANGFGTGQNYALVITAGTVDGVSVVGEVIAHFSIEARSALRPTTADRTLDVAVGGEAGVDLDNTVGTLAKGTDITGFNDLSAAQVNAEVDAALDTAIPVTPTAGSVNDKVKPLTFTTASQVDARVSSWLGAAPNALIAGRVDANAQVVGDKTGYGIGSGGIAAAAFAAGAITSSALDASATPRVLKNTALNNFMFLMVDSTDHITPKTGLSWAAGQAQVSIDGAAFGNLTNLPVEVGAGVYRINLAAADLNGDTIVLKFTATGADQRTVSLVTQP